MRIFSVILLLTVISAAYGGENLLTPQDFGLTLNQYHQIDMTSLPPDILVDCFNGDNYEDIARFTGNRVEIYFRYGSSFPENPDLIKYFNKNISAIRTEGDQWNVYRDIVVTFLDGTEERIKNIMGDLQINDQTIFTKYTSPPPHITEAEFQIVWQSEQKPFGMNRMAVDDIDNDGIIELCTWWMPSYPSDTGYILIYKSIGDNDYELFMEERFYTVDPNGVYLNFMMITDIDQNGQKELIFTRDYAYIWEFSAPGICTKKRSSFNFQRAVSDGVVSDVDQDGMLELAFVTVNTSFYPPCQYVVDEFNNKNQTTFVFIEISTFWQDPIDKRLDVGDFDNDGIVEMVSGTFLYVMTTNPVDLQYYKYDSTEIHNFSQEWLYTGAPYSCANPIISDIDFDGDNELIANGLYINGSSVFIWESTENDSGYVSWVDTTADIPGPNEAVIGTVDYYPSIVSVHGSGTNSFMKLFMFSDPVAVWSSPVIQPCLFFNPHIIDTDGDSKKSIIVSSSYNRRLFDWEQISSGIDIEYVTSPPSQFELLNVFPNPFNSTTKIKFALHKTQEIQISIYDITGRKIVELVNETYNIGEHSVEWNANDVSSGIYFISLESSNLKQVKKAVLMK